MQRKTLFLQREFVKRKVFLCEEQALLFTTLFLCKEKVLLFTNSLCQGFFFAKRQPLLFFLCKEKALLFTNCLCQGVFFAMRKTLLFTNGFRFAKRTHNFVQTLFYCYILLLNPYLLLVNKLTRNLLALFLTRVWGGK